MQFNLIQIFVFLMIFNLINPQKTATKSSKKEAIKKKRHEAALNEAKNIKTQNKDRKETVSDKIEKTIKSHLKNKS